MKKEDLNIVFFGTPEFAVKSLSAIIDNGYRVSAVVTMPDKTGGRGNKIIYSDVKKFALEKNLPLLQPENLKSEEFIEQLRQLNANLFIVIAFRMLPEKVWSMPALGTFNLHASLLPEYRGAAPINRAIMNGETKTGVTTFFLKHEIDEGDIIKQTEVDINIKENAGDLHDKLMVSGADLVIKTIESIVNESYTLTKQPDKPCKSAPKIFKQDCKINWEEKSENIYNHIRGLSPYPAAWTEMALESGEKISVKIFKTDFAEENKINGRNTGDIIVDSNRMYVATTTIPLEILEIQPAGKGRMPVSAFVQGYKPKSFE